MAVQLVPVLTVLDYEIQRFLEVELKLLYEDWTQVAGLNTLIFFLLFDIFVFYSFELITG